MTVRVRLRAPIFFPEWKENCLAEVPRRRDEGAALGGALQAAWCDGLRQGQKTSLTALAARSVAVNDSTRCAPERKRLALYRDLQAKQDGLSLTLRETFDRLGGG